MGSETLKIGDPVPAFKLLDENRDEVNMADYLGKGPLVIYFYPKDDTPGCTLEACSFRDQFTEFTDLGVTVFGISADSPESHAKFKQRYRLPYALLSDQGKRVQKLFKVKKNFLGLVDGRATYVIDSEGKVAYVFQSQLQPKKHISEALRILKRVK